MTQDHVQGWLEVTEEGLLVALEPPPHVSYVQEVGPVHPDWYRRRTEE